MNVISRKKLYIILIITIGVAMFSLSYYIAMEKFDLRDNNNSGKVQVNNNDEITVQGEGDLKLNNNTSIIFKIRYKKSGDLVVEKEDKASNLKVDTKNKLEHKFKKDGYKIEKASTGNIILVREENKYAPNKYVLGIKDDRIAIYKTDYKGNMYIENEKTDITDKKISNLKEQDISLLTNGDKYFQCDTKEEALARLEDYD
ncbi:hypothetical protein [Clostridium rectalis]|uniref:hypothetical protein n=1 Tax=Clostridium rectalis TaxID=2040295 RepID=UPI001FAA7397|nr:hypothetical protein [Clostridium rectalis]